ncbi:hypothetical protein [Enhygromyxa salina]|uniref:hypothetical protein n=1 Tax=Enhygromyxa salina TaxID=215803 RepID=UPI0011B26146|nr:hypothetical protein [Enhygromyxa salina]
MLDQDGTVRRGWGPLDANGCTPPISTPSPTDTQFVLQYALWSHFERSPEPDTFVLVYDCEQLEPCTLPRPYVGWTTAQGPMVQETSFIASADVGQEFREELLVYWASAFAESRISMGMEAHIYARVLGAADLGGGQVLACPDGYCPNGTTCETDLEASPFDHCRPKTAGTTNVGGHPTLDIAAGAVDGEKFSGAPESKFTIAHELGHVQTIWVSGSGTTMVNSNYDWCSVINGGGSNHTANSPEWQSAAIVEGFADFYAVAVYNQIESGAWFFEEDVENDTQRYQAQCQASLDKLATKGLCQQPGDATMCSDAGGSNEIDWAGALWDFTKVVGASELAAVLKLLNDAGMSGGWDPGSTSIDAYNNISQAASLRFPNNGADFNAAAQANGTNR